MGWDVSGPPVFCRLFSLCEICSCWRLIERWVYLRVGARLGYGVEVGLVGLRMSGSYGTFFVSLGLGSLRLGSAVNSIWIHWKGLFGFYWMVYFLLFAT